MSEGASKARVVEADRSQLAWGLIKLDADLPTDHMARVVWDFTGTLDLAALYAKIKARDDRPGRPAADPRVLLALWLLATIDGVGSARALARLAEQSLGYRWLAAGVPVNYHGLADFRTAHADVRRRSADTQPCGVHRRGARRFGRDYCRRHQGEGVGRSWLLQACGPSRRG